MMHAVHAVSRPVIKTHFMQPAIQAVAIAKVPQGGPLDAPGDEQFGLSVAQGLQIFLVGNPAVCRHMDLDFVLHAKKVDYILQLSRKEACRVSCPGAVRPGSMQDVWDAGMTARNPAAVSRHSCAYASPSPVSTHTGL